MNNAQQGIHANSNNWLGFTLSNSNLSVFKNSASAADGEEYAAAEEMSMVLGGAGPKLENFLGASSGSNNAVVGADLSPTVSNNKQLLLQPTMYEDATELNTISADFLGRRISGVGDDRDDQPPRQPMAAKKTAESFGQRTSVFRGVTRHRWTGRYEAHLWDNSCRREGKSRKGRQVYLGGYDKEDKAARAYDLAALKYWGPTTATNFPIGDYKRELEEMKNMTRQEFVASLRRRSSGFSRGASMYRGVTRHHQHGRWQARIGRVAGNKDLYLGTFSTQEEAAEAYDIAAIKFRGLNAVTNFDMSRYDVKSIANSSLPIGGMGNKPKTSSDTISEGRSDNDHDISESSISLTPHQQPHPIYSSLNYALPIKPDPAASASYWPGYGHNHITLATPSPSSYVTSSHFHSNNYAAAGPHYYCPSGTGSEAGSGRIGTSTMIPFPYNEATPISMTMTNSNNAIGTHECVSSSGNGISNWIGPNQLEYQSVKPSLSTCQTPIFGIE